MLGQCLDAGFVRIVLSATDERGVLIVEAAVGGLWHCLLLGVTGSASVTVKVSLYVFCQAGGSARRSDKATRSTRDGRLMAGSWYGAQPHSVGG